MQSTFSAKLDDEHAELFTKLRETLQERKGPTVRVTYRTVFLEALEALEFVLARQERERERKRKG